jgi:hypothetical protein
LIIVELVSGVALRALVVVIVHLDTFALRHDEAGVDALDFGHQLWSVDEPCDF